MRLYLQLETCNSLFEATPQYVSSKYANDLCGFDKTSHACNTQSKITIIYLLGGCSMNGWLQSGREVEML